MKNKQLFTLINSLGKLKDLKGVKFAYAIAKNKTKILAEVKCLQEAIQQLPKEMLDRDKEYEEKRIALAKKCSKMDKEGKPVIINGTYAIDNKELWEAEFGKLNKEYAALLESRKKAEEANNELLEKESTIAFHKIQEADIPEDISVEQLEIISDLITELKEI